MTGISLPRNLGDQRHDVAERGPLGDRPVELRALAGGQVPGPAGGLHRALGAGARRPARGAAAPALGGAEQRPLGCKEGVKVRGNLWYKDCCSPQTRDSRDEQLPTWTKLVVNFT